MTNSKLVNWFNGSKIKIAIVSIVVLTSIFVFVKTRYIDESGHEEYSSRYAVLAVGRALKRFESDYSRYPSNEEGLEYLTKPQNSHGPYIEELDVDGWGHPLIYKNTVGSVHPFLLYSIGANGVDESGLGDDIEFWAIKN